MLSPPRLQLAAAAAFLLLTACGPTLSADEAMVVGKWQLNTHNGAVWRYSFYRDHTLTVSLPHDDAVDANQRNAKFHVVDSGTWRVEGSEVVYTLKAEGQLPERTTRFPLAELRAARRFPDRDAPRWERM